jgi:hypothetical protein
LSSLCTFQTLPCPQPGVFPRPQSLWTAPSSLLTPCYH